MTGRDRRAADRSEPAADADTRSVDRPVPTGTRPESERSGGAEPADAVEPDPEFRRLAWHLFVASAGAETRRRLIAELEGRGPANANQLAGWLDCDYSTARHHLERLQDEDLVVTPGISNGYDVRYALGPRLEANLEWVRSLVASAVDDGGATE